MSLYFGSKIIRSTAGRSATSFRGIVSGYAVDPEFRSNLDSTLLKIGRGGSPVQTNFQRRFFNQAGADLLCLRSLDDFHQVFLLHVDFNDLDLRIGDVISCEVELFEQGVVTPDGLVMGIATKILESAQPLTSRPSMWSVKQGHDNVLDVDFPPVFGSTSLMMLAMLQPLSLGDRFVVFAPAGAGKTTFALKLMHEVRPGIKKVLILVERMEEGLDYDIRDPDTQIIRIPASGDPLLKVSGIELAIQLAMRIAEKGENVILLLESATKGLFDPLRTAGTSEGQGSMSGGVTPGTISALEMLLSIGGRLKLGTDKSGSITVIPVVLEYGVDAGTLLLRGASTGIATKTATLVQEIVTLVKRVQSACGGALRCYVLPFNLGMIQGGNQQRSVEYPACQSRRIDWIPSHWKPTLSRYAAAFIDAYKSSPESYFTLYLLVEKLTHGCRDEQEFVDRLEQMWPQVSAITSQLLRLKGDEWMNAIVGLIEHLNRYEHPILAIRLAQTKLSSIMSRTQSLSVQPISFPAPVSSNGRSRPSTSRGNTVKLYVPIPADDHGGTPEKALSKNIARVLAGTEGVLTENNRSLDDLLECISDNPKGGKQFVLIAPLDKEEEIKSLLANVGVFVVGGLKPPNSPKKKAAQPSGPFTGTFTETDAQIISFQAEMDRYAKRNAGLNNEPFDPWARGVSPSVGEDKIPSDDGDLEQAETLDSKTQRVRFQVTMPKISGQHPAAFEKFSTFLNEFLESDGPDLVLMIGDQEVLWSEFRLQNGKLPIVETKRGNYGTYFLASMAVANKLKDFLTSKPPTFYTGGSWQFTVRDITPYS